MVIVTGATGGIGSALVRRVIESDYACVAIARNIEKLQKSDISVGVDKLLLSDYRLDYPKFSIDNNIFNQSKNITLVLNAFDITPIKPVANLTADEIGANIGFNIEKQLEVIIKTWKISCQLNIPLRVVCLDSGAAYKPISGWSMYCAGKAYINMFLQVFSKENDVPLVLYDPGVVDTNMQKKIRESSEDNFPTVNDFIDFYKNGQLNKPDEVAQDILDRYILNWTASELCERFKR